MSARDAAYMLRAIELSRKGFPAPNPRVGCVIVQEDQVVGQGYHDHAGGDHAEVVAINDAGSRAKDSEVYITLEPCNHTGRTPPCTSALISAGVRRVVIACEDPNKIASGGIQALRDTGIEVVVGCQRDAALEVNKVFHFAHEKNRPYVVAKAAVSLDGFLAREDGSSKWITGEAARAMGHQLRAELGAVIVGRKTVQLDDPKLTARIAGVVNQPIRIILDPRRTLTGQESIFRQEGATLWVVHGEPASDNEIGVTLRPDGALDLDDLLKKLWDRRIIGVLIEGGAETISAFFSAKLVDRLDLFISPSLFGAGTKWLNSSPLARLEGVSVAQLGKDTWVSGEIHWDQGTSMG